MARRFQQRQQEIVQRAAELFANGGYQRTSMADIASSLGMLKGSLYYYIKSKRDLLAKAFIGIAAELSDNLTKIIESEASWTEKVRGAFENHIELLYQDNARVIVFIDERLIHLNGSYRRRAIRERDHYESLWQVLVSKGIEQKEFRADLDVKIVVRGLLGMCNWMVKWYKPDGKCGPSEIAQIFAEVALQGIRRVPCVTEQRALQK